MSSVLKKAMNGNSMDAGPEMKKTRLDPEHLIEEVAVLHKSNALLKQELQKLQENPNAQVYPEVVIRDLGDNFYGVYHNLSGPSRETPYDVKYICPTSMVEGHRFEVRVDDLGEKETTKKYEIGIGMINVNDEGGNNRSNYGFDMGCVSSLDRVLHVITADQRDLPECVDGPLMAGDILSFEIMKKYVRVQRNGKKSSEVLMPHNSPNYEYQIFIGFNNRFEKITLAYNKEFRTRNAEAMKKFPKKDLKVCVATMNEGSPNYASGVSKGGTHLLSDGTLVRRLSEDGRRIMNYQPGSQAENYDAKFGGYFRLSDILFDNLIRNRIQFAGNMVTVTRKRADEYKVKIRCITTGQEKKFTGSDAQWLKERESLLSYGERFIIDLPSKAGEIGTRNLTIAGTKCKTISNLVYTTMQHEIMEQDGVTKNTPALLLLGGDRLMTVGSITGALRAHKDLCIIFFDAHFDFRDPDATEYVMGHGSPLYFLLQKHLKEAINTWESSPQEADSHVNRTIRDAIKFLKSTPQGEAYWKSLRDTKRGYRGFNWLTDTEELEPQRIAFTGVRQKEVEAGSSLGSPLVTLFLNLLNLQPCMYTKEMIANEGVANIFPKIIKQFRGTFEDDYLAMKDAEYQRENPDGNGKWIPPIFVSWDVDVIDPKDNPCCIFQEPNGLVAEECLAIADEIANTKSMVAFETVEFNPDLWGGYRDEPIMWTINEFEMGPLNRNPREPVDKNKHRLDRQHATRLIQDMIVRAFDPTPKRVASFKTE